MKRTLLLLPILLLALATLHAAPPVDEGKALFNSRCAACHNINKDLTGPALAGLDERRSMDWIIKFVHSPQAMIQSGDKEAVALFAKFNNVLMPDHADLTDAQIKNMVEYIKGESKASAAEEAPFARPEKMRPAYQPLSPRNYGFFLSYLAVVALLVGVLLFAVQVKEFERRTAVR